MRTAAVAGGWLAPATVALCAASMTIAPDVHAQQTGQPGRILIYLEGSGLSSCAAFLSARARSRSRLFRMGGGVHRVYQPYERRSQHADHDRSSALNA